MWHSDLLSLSIAVFAQLDILDLDMQDWVLLLFLLSNDVDMKVFRTILLWLNLFDFLMLCIAL